MLRIVDPTLQPEALDRHQRLCPGQLGQFAIGIGTKHGHDIGRWREDRCLDTLAEAPGKFSSGARTEHQRHQRVGDCRAAGSWRAVPSFEFLLSDGDGQWSGPCDSRIAEAKEQLIGLLTKPGGLLAWYGVVIQEPGQSLDSGLPPPNPFIEAASQVTNCLMAQRGTKLVKAAGGAGAEDCLGGVLHRHGADADLLTDPGHPDLPGADPKFGKELGGPRVSDPRR